MDTTRHSSNFSFSPINNQRLANLCGPCNEHLRQLEDIFDVEIHQRSNIFQVIGEQEGSIRAAGDVLTELYQETSSEEILTPDKVFLVLKQIQRPPVESDTMKSCLIQIAHGPIKPRSKHQETYINNVHQHDINFAIGPAGTGKTYLAVACAVEALEKGDVQRLIFVRPAVEAGEKLGFLPGDLKEKILPYLRPIYDALYEMLGFDQANKLIEKDVIEIAPLAFMRGRTLNDAFIILDEAQNTTRQQMKMFLTRIGFGSTAVITGDITQVDLPSGEYSGLKHAMDIIKGIDNISFSHFDAKDAVRHPLVQSIIKAYQNDRDGE